MMSTHAEIEYNLLKMVAEEEKPVGAGYLSDALQIKHNMTVSEATVGRYLRRFEQNGFLSCEKYDKRARGRKITESGMDRLRKLEQEHEQKQMLRNTLEIFTNSFGEQLKNVLEVRQIIEPAAAELAAKNADKEAISALEKIVEETASLTGQGLSMASKDAEFHIEIAKASGNPVLETVMRMIRADRDYSPEIERMINVSAVNNSSDHLNIFLAVKEHDPEKARRIMKQHIHKLLVKLEAYETP